MKIDISQLGFEAFHCLMGHREFSRLVYNEVTKINRNDHIANCIQLVKNAENKIPAIKAVRTYSQLHPEAIAIVEDFMGMESSMTEYFGLTIAKYFVERLMQENDIKFH